VDCACGTVARGQCHVEPFARQARVEGGICEGGFFGNQGAVDRVFKRVQRGTSGLAFLGRHFAQLAHLQRYLALFTKGLHAQILQTGFVPHTGNQGQVF